MLELGAPVQARKPVGFELVRRADKDPEILRHFALYGCAKIKENSTLNVRLIELLAEAITANVGIDSQEVILVPVYRSAQHHKILLKHEG